MMRLLLLLLPIGFGGCLASNPDFENGLVVAVPDADAEWPDAAGDQSWHDRQLIDRCIACPECCALDAGDPPDDAGDNDCDGNDCDDAGDPPDDAGDPPDDAGDNDCDGNDCDAGDDAGDPPDSDPGVVDAEPVDAGDGPDWCGQLERFLVQRCPGESFPEYMCPWVECMPNDFLRCLETLSTGGCRPPEELADCRCHGG